jgi:hypothetical protein
MLFPRGRHECLLFYLGFVPEMMKIKQHWQTPDFRRGAPASRSLPAATPFADPVLNSEK